MPAAMPETLPEVNGLEGRAALGRDDDLFLLLLFFWWYSFAVEAPRLGVDLVGVVRVYF